jgi:uncharacterized repeat protein (TIGR01451 family)
MSKIINMNNIRQVISCPSFLAFLACRISPGNPVTLFKQYCLGKNKYIHKNNWYRKAVSTILLTSSLQGMTAIPAQAQETGTQLNQRQLNFVNTASYTYSFTDPDTKETVTIKDMVSQENRLNSGLIDPFGQILDCAGNLLPDYTGWSVGLYEPTGVTGTELGGLVDLTTTEVPDDTNNNIPLGINPNTTNQNPFTAIPNSGEFAGFYSFLFDKNRGQIDLGKTYILAIRPPINDAEYPLRRIQIKIEETFQNGADTVVRYTATSLDGLPITLNGDEQITGLEVFVSNAAAIGLNLLAFRLSTNMCQVNQARIVKTGDRATAAPGDTVVYRVSVTNNSDAGLKRLSITDILPLGFRFLANSVRGELGGQPVTITSAASGNTIRFAADGVTMAEGQSLNIVYATQLTNDAQRGSGRNSAVVEAQRDDNNGLVVRDGPAIHYLKVVQGIITDAGTIVGRVFVDKNFDGEQQNGEPGVPNAVIYLQDGNRITTDPNGLFSVANVLPGYHTGVLDLTSLPGYTLAPNKKFNERNSQSRLVHLAPGGLVRMNFAVTPTFKEQVEK